MFKFYKPKLWLILTDLFLISVNIFVVFRFFPLTTQNPIEKYFVPANVLIAAWLVVSYFFDRYNSIKSKSFIQSAFSLFFTSVIILVIFGSFILIQPASPYSQNVLISVLMGVFVSLYLFLFAYYLYRYAVTYDTPNLNPDKRLSAVPQPSHPMSDDAVTERYKRITEFSGEKVINYLQKNTMLYESGTYIFTEFNEKELEDIEHYQYSTYIQLKRLNHIRGINKMLALVNEKLPDNGILVCCYKSQSTIKQRIFDKYPRPVALTVYIFYFLYHRVMPKFFLTKRLYYDLTEGKKRVLSKTEVLGRLNYCGFMLERQSKINDMNFVVARRVKNAAPLLDRNYGPLIKLKRTGKNGKTFSVYKFRTMHPYAEFLQQYVYENNDLQEGGKFKRDIRVTSMGRFMRKYWIDELPMLINLIKGDMKLVGVRPLSKQYFNLYTPELQQKRTNYRPGLLPPFYADMPKTLDEIQASELRYLKQCETNGELRTDFKYFFLILKNILFNKARSA